jgi:hypothetical protein
MYSWFEDMVIGRRNKEKLPVVFDGGTKWATDFTF